MAGNKVLRTYTFDLEVIKPFEEKVNSGDRSRILGELMKDYLERFFPEKTNKTAERDFELKKLEIRRNEIYSIIEKEKKEEENKEKQMVEAASFEKNLERVSERKESLRSKARLVSMQEFGLTDELLYDEKWLSISKNQDLINDWKIAWRKLTKEFYGREGL